MKALWEILVPTIFNDGRPIKVKHHKVWDKMVQGIAGGLTINPPSKGQWLHKAENKLYEERMIPVMIRATSKEIQEIADKTLDHYEQYEVLYYKVSDESHLVAATQGRIEEWKIKNKLGIW